MHEMTYDILGLDYSPIKGPEGNTEYLLYMKKKSAADSNINREADEEIWNAYLEGVGELVETALGATV